MTDGGGEISLTPPQVQAQVQLESLNAARTGLNNALINAGLATPTDVAGAKPFTQPMTVAGQVQTTTAPVVTPGKPLNQMTPEELEAYQKARLAKVTKTRETGGGTEPPYPAPINTHWSFISGEWKLYKDDPKVIEARENANYSGAGTKDSPFLYKGKPFTGTRGFSRYIDGIWQDPNAGASSNKDTTTNPPITTTSTTNLVDSTPKLAVDVFKNTLALFFGQEEMAKPWANELYAAVSKFYKTGATVDESFNLALQDARKNPALVDFTKRFKGIFDLQDKRAAGQPVTVPTIAEYFATQSKMADLLKTTGLNDLANETFLGDVIGKGVSATEFGNRITNIFDRIDLAPQEMKDTLARYFPTLDRTQLAKALALGEKGSMQLQKELAGYEVLAAAEEQGLGALGVGAIAGGLTEERAASLAAGGETFQSALGKFKTVAQIKVPAAKLAGIYGTGPMTQEDIENIVFKQSARETQALENLVNLEQSAFSGQAGTIGSRSFASQARGAGLI